MPNLAYDTSRDGPVAVIAPTGELDLSGAAVLEVEIDRLLDDPGVGTFVLDQRGLDDLDSSGLRLVVVTDMPEKYAVAKLPPGVGVEHRDELDRIQRELREVEGVTAMIYDQTCATEKRRRRKRGTMVDPALRVGTGGVRVVVHEQVGPHPEVAGGAGQLHQPLLLQPSRPR